MCINLCDMKQGDRGRVVGFRKNFLPYQKKLLSMGLTPGTEFELVRIASLGDPVEIRVRGTDLSLRRGEVAGLKIERLKSEAPRLKPTPEQKSEYTIAVIGNPNCGKTTLFNGLTGARQHVGNWAGVTVEQKTGFYRYENKAIKVVDLPGIYALDVNETATSLDEKIARDYILSQQADLIINIVDTSHLEHNLYLTIQLLEMELPILVVLNNMDDTTGKGIKIDSDELARNLDCPLVSLIATRADDIRALKATINQLAENKTLSTFSIDYPLEVKAALDKLSPLVEQKLANRFGNSRWFAGKLLERDGFALSHADALLTETAEKLRSEIEDKATEDADIIIIDSRYGFISLLVQKTLTRQSGQAPSLSDTIDNVVLNRFLAIPIFLGVMYLMFTFTIKLGRVFKPFFNDLAQAFFVDGLGAFLGLMNCPQWLITLIATGVGNGIREVAAFIPILGFLYLFISVLEESGYMARATFAMDRFMRVLGLPGKAFVPMILGFGCNVPAMLATRTLERPRDRLLSMVLNPFMTCGARLVVFTLFAAAFFPDNGGMVVFVLYMIGIVAALLTALLLKHSFLKEESSLVMMEIPSYHIPKLKNVLINSWTRLKAFMVRVGKIIITMVVILNLLSSLGTDGSYQANNIEHSVLSAAGRALTPTLAPLGIREDNWPATVALFTGILHKAVVISTLKTIYSESPAAKAALQAQEFNLYGAVKRAFMTIPMGLKKMIGIGVTQPTSQNTFISELHTHFEGQVGAFAYLLFILLYFPCIATLAAAYRESSLRWSVFMVFWSTGLAYLTATLFYQLATYSQHPRTSMAWLTMIALIIIAVVLIFRYWGGQHQASMSNNAIKPSTKD
ncbi:MAG: Fe(2+) transporter permease subunit FeoB [Methylicorpusculum sp.]|uniref:Fe(2+) transporter permease subunit FeoB n=1 Tax=Methylicorpusculum sp. TaxID=2713644 RepID=UPI00271EEF71|nr:Fe(2+) transporter permease subunit FeoB [Methylicorpusculum sp.]MDO8940808.1 Fe(2+) transporter permease subunit FeoB [Methylicorpusculum sp.]MDP2204429.1 Fe(2+) transporter permease subunit FeoB [Methylicorpusculum sp.]